MKLIFKVVSEALRLLDAALLIRLKTPFKILLMDLNQHIIELIKQNLTVPVCIKICLLYKIEKIIACSATLCSCQVRCYHFYIACNQICCSFPALKRRVYTQFAFQTPYFCQ